MTKEDLKKYIKDVPDFPKEGIIFKDISPLLCNAEAYNNSISWISELIEDNVDVVVSPDARGFLFGPQAASKRGMKFVMARKAGKLPGNKIKVDFKLEYGDSQLEMIEGLIKPGDRVSLIDDVLATGGTTNALIELVEKQGGLVESAIFLAEISFLKGKEKINIDSQRIKSLISF